VRLFWHQLRFEQLIFWRSREAAFFIFGFPLLLFVLLGSVYTGKIDGYPGSSVLLVGMLGYGAANTAFAGTAILLVNRREYGILKRIRSTPLPAGLYLACVVVSSLLVFVLDAVALVAVGRIFFGAHLPSQVGSLLLTILLGTTVFAAIGLAAAAVIRSAEGSSAVVNFILLPMAFLSGSFGPTRKYPHVLRAIGDVLPLKYFIEVVKAVYLGGHQVWAKPGALAVLAGWTAFGLLVAARRFGWEPRER
jgi:ABC-2 type transport system permease protein